MSLKVEHFETNSISVQKTKTVQQSGTGSLLDLDEDDFLNLDCLIDLKSAFADFICSRFFLQPKLSWV